nr:hypothetical protein [Tanacetum cinerariifolium]
MMFPQPVHTNNDVETTQFYGRKGAKYSGYKTSIGTDFHTQNNHFPGVWPIVASIISTIGFTSAPAIAGIVSYFAAFVTLQSARARVIALVLGALGHISLIDFHTQNNHFPGVWPIVASIISSIGFTSAPAIAGIVSYFAAFVTLQSARARV